MPHIFKPLATITAWILFINGCLGMIGSVLARLAGEAGLAPPLAWGVAVNGIGFKCTISFAVNI